VLYDDCDTKEESEVFIMCAALRHHLTDAALQDFTKLVDCHLPRKCHVEVLIFKVILGQQLSYILLLSGLHHYFKFLELIGKCDNCYKEYNQQKLKSDKKYFFNLPLKIQLIALINFKHFLHFRKENDIKSDIINDTFYQS